MNLTELKKMPVPELNELAQSMNIEGVARSRKQDLIFAILKAHAKKVRISTVMACPGNSVRRFRFSALG